MSERPEGGYKAKVVIIGDGAIGKTCLLKRMTTDIDAAWEDFGVDYEATTFGQQQLKWEGESGEEFHIELWDTAGQESLESLRGMSYPGTDVMIIGYNCTDPGSLQNIEYTWVPEFTKSIGEDVEQLYMIIAGTKVDMREGMDADKVVAATAGQDKAVTLKACNWIETSAKTSDGVSELQQMIMDAIQLKASGEPSKNHVYTKPAADLPAPRASATGTKKPTDVKPVDSEYHEKLKEHESKPKADAKPAAQAADVKRPAEAETKTEPKKDAACCLIQ
jgi:small GTP-binding protein